MTLLCRIDEKLCRDDVLQLQLRENKLFRCFFVGFVDEDGNRNLLVAPFVVEILSDDNFVDFRCPGLKIGQIKALVTAVTMMQVLFDLGV